MELVYVLDLMCVRKKKISNNSLQRQKNYVRLGNNCAYVSKINIPRRYFLVGKP